VVFFVLQLLGTGAEFLSSSAVDEVRPFYSQHEERTALAPHSSPQTQHHSSSTTEHSSLTSGTVPPSRGFPYTADGLSSTYPLLPVRTDGPLQSLEGLASDGVPYMGSAGVISSSYVEAPRPSLIDASPSSYTMSLPPYPVPDVDQSKLVNRVPSYLPPYAAAHTAVNDTTIESSSPVYGRSVPPAMTPSAFPSDAFTKEFFGQYLHDTPPGPLHPLATHGTLHDQHAAAAANILGGYQQPSTLPTMPHGAGGSELFRRAYSGVSDNLFGGMKSSAQSALGPPAPQSQHWMSSADSPRRWNHTPPDMPRYNYPPGRTELAETAKTLPPAPAPMSKRPEDMTMMFGSTTAASSSVHYPLSGRISLFLC